MRAAALALTACVALLGCDEAVQTADEIGRKSAKAAVSKALATRYPNLPGDAITPVSDCVIDHATLPEVRRFAQDSVTGVDDATLALLGSVLSRPETQTCVAKRGVALLTAL